MLHPRIKLLEVFDRSSMLTAVFQPLVYLSVLFSFILRWLSVPSSSIKYAKRPRRPGAPTEPSFYPLPVPLNAVIYEL